MRPKRIGEVTLSVLVSIMLCVPLIRYSINTNRALYIVNVCVLSVESVSSFTCTKLYDPISCTLFAITQQYASLFGLTHAINDASGWKYACSIIYATTTVICAYFISKSFMRLRFMLKRNTNDDEVRVAVGEIVTEPNTTNNTRA